MYKLVIFDLDGTLVNSLFDLGDSVNAVLEEEGLPTFDYEAYKYMVGNGTVKLIERALPDNMRTKDNIEAFHRRFAEQYQRRCLDKTRPYVGIDKALSFLKSSSVKLAVASNKPDEFAKFIVSNVFDDGTFDIVIGKREGVPTKPDPAIINDILSAAKVPPEETLIAGDSDVDVFTAHNAGIKCIGCEWGFRGRDELEQAGADFIISRPEELTELFR
ncbi:MAG: HAD family hydrolase [Ruminococcus sp.]|nr:HAD family hydrolase [Ruminococcus sp.]